ncbi:hypothetical protein [Achromobacter xylosoxidans]|uniref:hypothetical protein n=1 Tax=Alcaligenes xylosoxydans xylosoxydans TaxID=85698 RepID=UPI001F0E9110|nr:hypothetical protein [Achromobacter xylosoxidans]MCH4572270.1 hypothetical protein [Achromobacter xylosoxidans]
MKISLRPGVPKTELFQSPTPCEKAAALPISNYGTGAPNPWPILVRLADVYLPDCRAGDILDVSAAFQGTNKYVGHNIEFTGRLIFTPHADSLAGSNIETTGVGFGGLGLGFNVSNNMHHGILNLNGRYRVSYDVDGYVAVIAYAGGDASLPSPSIPNPIFPIDPGGHLSVIRHRSFER